MVKKKRVLLIGPFPKPITGNSLANKVVYNGLFKKKEFDVKLINTSLPFFDESIGKLSLRKVLINIGFVFKAFKIFGVDVVYITPGQSFLGVLKYAPYMFLAKLLSKKIVVHIHGNYLGTMYGNLGQFQKYLAKFVLSKADEGVVLSESLTGNLTPFLSSEKIHSIYNFYEDDLGEDIRAKIEQKDFKKLKVLYLSNLMIEKGIIDLLEALTELKKNGIEFEANLAGNIDAAHRLRIEEYLERLKPEVKYLGVVQGNEKKELLLRSNVFVFPTYYKMEGQPISILEALITGNVVITTNHAGIPDVFSNKNGYFVKKKSPIDIYDKLINLRESAEAKTMIMDNHKYAKKNFTEDKFISNLSDLLLRM